MTPLLLTQLFILHQLQPQTQPNILPNILPQPNQISYHKSYPKSNQISNHDPTPNPTKYPTIPPTADPTNNPTTTTNPTTDELDTNWLTMERVVPFSSALVLVLVLVIFICMIKVKKTHQKRDENVISNALVALIVIGEYDDCIADDGDADIEQQLSSLPLEADLRHLTELFSILNYNIITPNDDIKLHWKADEVVSFLQNDVGKALFDVNNELNYDGLIVAISSH
eukprot:911304_1